MRPSNSEQVYRICSILALRSRRVHRTPGDHDCSLPTGSSVTEPGLDLSQLTLHHRPAATAATTNVDNASPTGTSGSTAAGPAAIRYTSCDAIRVLVGQWTKVSLLRVGLHSAGYMHAGLITHCFSLSPLTHLLCCRADQRARQAQPYLKRQYPAPPVNIDVKRSTIRPSQLTVSGIHARQNDLH